jgi:Protein of unknown function (DUF2815)
MTKPYAGGKPIFNEYVTPIGLIAYAYHDKPSLKTNDRTKQPILDENGIQEAEYKVTIAWSKTRLPELQPFIDLAFVTQEQGWPGSTQPGAFFALEPLFRDGDNPAHNTKNREFLHDRYYLNFKQKAIPTRDPQTGRVTYGGAPGLLGPYGPEDKIMPVDIYAGCTGRVSGIMFCTEYAGKHFVSLRLNNIQKYEDGDRIGGGSKPTAESQFGAIKDGVAGMMPGGMPGFPPVAPATSPLYPATALSVQRDAFGFPVVAQQGRIM